MGLLEKILGQRSEPTGAAAASLVAEAVRSAPPLVPASTRIPVTIFPGAETLEVVGESHYLTELWTIVGAEFQPGDHVRYDTVAVLIPEPDNPYDSNAIAVTINGLKVGYLSRDDARRYLPGLRDAMKKAGGSFIGLRADIVGRGGDDSLALLGVFLDHDPADFGLRSSHSGELRTGFGSVPTSWYTNLTGEVVHDIAELRRLLESERVPLSRHYMFAELERRIYRSRDVFTSAIHDYDDVCEQHHSEMKAIRQALISQRGAVPLIEMYKQQAIRWKKVLEWENVCRWAERGLEVYGNDAARLEDVEDLEQRRDHAIGKQLPKATNASRHREALSASPATETLICTRCGASFTRTRARGRKPLLCPDCRG
jgi:hypothetical protein